MDFEYIVEIKNIAGITLDRETYQDSNTAYHEYRKLRDQYRDNLDIVVVLHEPEEE